jgi:large subunit ribosomal protein L6
MSRIGKQKLNIPDKVEVKIEPHTDGEIKGTRVSVKGPLGTVAKIFPASMSVAVEDKVLTCAPSREGDIENSAIWGTCTAHLANMLEGVTKGFQKKLTIEGIGYKAEVSGQNLTMALGFSHPVKISIPKELKVVMEKNVMTISGADKDVLGQFAAVVVAHKPPEPYKGKGIIYEGQVIKRKQGKRSTT